MTRNNLDEAIRTVAGLGGPGVVLLAAIAYASATMGVAGAAAITAALSLLGGPAGMYGGLIALPVIGVLSAAIASYGLEAILIAIYEKRIENSNDTNIQEVCINEIDDIIFLNSSQKTKIKSAIKKEFTILVIGKTGTGKSSTINSLIGQQLASTGDSIAVTDSIKSYSTTLNSIKIKVLDTPGLCDSLEKSNDERYLKEIKNAYEDVDLTFFITVLNESRVSRDEKVALRSLTSELGEKIWKNMIIIFTFANSELPEEIEYQEFLSGRTQAIQKFIEEISSEKIAQQMPFIAIDNTQKSTPDGTIWLPELFTLIIERVKESGLFTFLEAMADDVIEDENSTNSSSSGFDEEPRINLDDEQKQRVRKSLRESIFGPALAGMATGGLVGGLGGAIAGGLGGTLFGLWRYLNK